MALITWAFPNRISILCTALGTISGKITRISSPKVFSFFFGGWGGDLLRIEEEFRSRIDPRKMGHPFNDGVVCSVEEVGGNILRKRFRF